ncbi:MAG TPA: DUF4129 domain-containing protein [Methylomirabilota bacterium]|nr:DUF4129 domain-containing protein [Methylomirabilota bacterium]
MTAPRPARFSVPGRLGICAAVALGLLLVLAAMVGPPPAPAEDPGARVAVRLPDPVQVLVVGLLGLSAVIFFSLQRRRSADDDTPPPARVVRPMPAWLALVVSLLPVALVALGWYLLWRYGGEDGEPIERALAAISGLLDLLTLADKPPTSIPSLDLAIATLAVLLALGVFGLMVLIALADRLEAWRAERGSPAAAPSVPDALREIRADLRAEPDARLAIVRAYGRFERALAAARAPRAAWQTPAEFMRSTLARMPVPAPPVRRLTALFEIARFSAHPVGAEARDAACDCLDEITTALDEDAARAR